MNTLPGPVAYWKLTRDGITYKGVLKASDGESAQAFMDRVNAALEAELGKEAT